MILIVGAGAVGSAIARDLAETNEVRVIDRDPDRIDALTGDLDVAGVAGDGRSLSVLEEAGLDRAEVVVASTDSDAANIMICNAATEFGDPDTVARVKDLDVYRTWQGTDGGLGVDAMVAVDVVTAETVARTLAVPGATAVESFADGTVEIAEFELDADAPIVGSSVADVDRSPSVTFTAIFRDEGLVIPDGDTVFRAGDRVVVMGGPHGVSGFAETVGAEELPNDEEVLVVGGDPLGYQIARALETRGINAEIVERDPDRVEQLRDELDDATVTEADAIRVGGFDPAILDDARVVVGATDDDTNYLLTRLARERGIERTAAVVRDLDVVELFERTTDGVVVHPQDSLAGEILGRLYDHGPESVGVFEHDDAEVFEIVVDADSVLTGQPLETAVDRLPARCVVGAVIRGGSLDVPRGNHIIQSGDRVFVFLETSAAPEIADLI
ncbi:MAG: Trk system potassium transporter TrkA [Halorhabdus sp.]